MQMVDHKRRRRSARTTLTRSRRIPITRPGRIHTRAHATFYRLTEGARPGMYLRCVCYDAHAPSTMRQMWWPWARASQGSLLGWSRDQPRSFDTSHPWHCCLPGASLQEAFQRWPESHCRWTTTITRSCHVVGHTSIIWHGPHEHITCLARLGSHP